MTVALMARAGVVRDRASVSWRPRPHRRRLPAGCGTARAAAATAAAERQTCRVLSCGSVDTAGDGGGVPVCVARVGSGGRQAVELAPHNAQRHLLAGTRWRPVAACTVQVGRNACARLDWVEVRVMKFRGHWLLRPIRVACRPGQRMLRGSGCVTNQCSS